ncbi:zinc finger CCCH domain-containing protein 42-like [Vigna umbellata]|uniref:zinc finger CCCH domain-containing protein 42-like n=1 Tax=Vigna umbellata TaxID=87088 RepID=UPI001F5EBF11|nr:zinc finger CCCH domain-containing protein 42-like [Vigna umbellata]
MPSTTLDTAVRPFHARERGFSVPVDAPSAITNKARRPWVRGASCKFSHDEQRAANTGWGQKEDNPKWGHDKFEGPKKERGFGTNQPNHNSETRDRDSRSKARSNDAAFDNQPKRSDREERSRRWRDDDDTYKGRENNNRREEKGSRRYGDDEFEHNSREERYRREEKKSRKDDYDDIPEQTDHRRREDKRSIKPDDGEYELKLRDSLKL